MAFTVYPVGSSTGFTEESELDSDLDRLIAGLGSRLSDFVVDPFTGGDFGLTNPSGLDAQIATGDAFVGGHFVRSGSAETRTLTASSTNYVFLVVDDNKPGNADIVVNTDGSTPATKYAVKLWEATTDASTITGQTDFRPWVPFKDEAPANNITGRQHGTEQFTVDATGVQTQTVTLPHAYVTELDGVELSLGELSDTSVRLAYPPRVPPASKSTTGFDVELNVSTAAGAGATLTVEWTAYGE